MRRIGVSRLLIADVIIVTLFFFSGRAGGEECTDCHREGKNRGAPIIKSTAGSAHAGKKCEDCHRNVVQPCPPQTPALSCDACHKKQVKLLGRSTHGKKIPDWLAERKIEVTLDHVCLACHGKDVHYFPLNNDPASPVFPANSPATCLACHQEDRRQRPSDYSLSVHATVHRQDGQPAAVCFDCHGNHYIQEKKFDDALVNPKAQPETCGKCHAWDKENYLRSRHWEGIAEGKADPPVCSSCHGGHLMFSGRDQRSRVWPARVTKVCADCHGSEKLARAYGLSSKVVPSFVGSYHGLMRELGDLRAAGCASCHGHHGILPPEDQASPVNQKNLGSTCGRCHLSAASRFIRDPVHVVRASGFLPSRLVKYFYLAVIFGTALLMMAHNLGDALHRRRKGPPHERAEVLAPRFNLTEKTQHILLVVSFILLAYTGLILSFPGSVLAAPFRAWPDGALLRNFLHRFAAAVFLGLCLFHFGYLVLSARGRRQLRLMMPGLRDVADARAVAEKYTGRNDSPLLLPHYSYIEKFEYWAMVWGGIIMTATGLILLFTDKLLGVISLSILDLASTIHFYEALLAVVALVLWHGYWATRK